MDTNIKKREMWCLLLKIPHHRWKTRAKPSTHSKAASHYLYDITKARFIFSWFDSLLDKKDAEHEKKGCREATNQKEIWSRSLFVNLIQQERSQIKPLAKQVFVDDGYTNACQPVAPGARISLLRMRNYSHLTDFLEPGRKSQQRKLAACN